MLLMNGFDELVFEEGIGGCGDTDALALCQVAQFHADGAIQPDMEGSLGPHRFRASRLFCCPVARSGGLFGRTRVDCGWRIVGLTALILHYRAKLALLPCCQAVGTPTPLTCSLIHNST